MTLYKSTARYRFAPADTTGDTHSYNPLSLISTDRKKRLSDIQRIAQIMIPDNNKTDTIWS